MSSHMEREAFYPTSGIPMTLPSLSQIGGSVSLPAALSPS